MSRVTPPASRASVNDTGDGFELSIPTRKNWFVIVFIGAWMGGWFMGETSAISRLMGDGVKNSGFNAFLALWLVAWTVGGIAGATAWLWNIAGVERAKFRSDAAFLRREILGIGFDREYDTGHIRNLRVADPSADITDWHSRFRATGLAGGSIAFDYGSSTIRFASGIEEAEASQIVSQIRSRFLFARS